MAFQVFRDLLNLKNVLYCLRAKILLSLSPGTFLPSVVRYLDRLKAERHRFVEATKLYQPERRRGEKNYRL